MRSHYLLTLLPGHCFPPIVFTFISHFRAVRRDGELLLAMTSSGGDEREGPGPP